MLLKRRRHIAAAMLLALLCGTSVLVVGPNIVIYNDTTVPLHNVDFGIYNHTAYETHIHMGDIQPGEHVKKRLLTWSNTSVTIHYNMNGKIYNQYTNAYVNQGMGGTLEFHITGDDVILKDRLRVGF